MAPTELLERKIQLSEYLGFHRGGVMDDSRIYLKSEEDHAQHLSLVLLKFREKQWYGKFSKCEFWLHDVVFWGM